MFRKFLILSIAVTCLTACSMAPDYSRPEAPVSATWPQGQAYMDVMKAPDAKAVTEIPWQSFFVNPQLQKLIDLALTNNRDLRVATLNIQRSQAQYQIQRSEQFPRIDADTSANYQRLAEDFSGTGHSLDIHQYTIGLGVSSYELDLFGRVKNLKDQALQQFFATGQARRSVQISLVAEVAASYLRLAADRELLKLAKDTLMSQQASHKLINKRYASGVSSALDLHQAQISLDTARGDVSRFTTFVAQDENALNQVVGSTVPFDLLPGALSETLTAVKDLQPRLPSDVLLSRPDILEAEALLKAANANIGAARAAFFPRITLVSSIGFGSEDLSGLFTDGASAWQFAPRISLPIFNAGSNQASLKVAEVNRDMAVAQYEKAIQTAFREVADALALRGTIDEQVAAQQSLTSAAGAIYRLSQARYEEGNDSYLNVLDSQRSFYGSEKNLISVRLARLINQVTIYKVLGGGSGSEQVWAENGENLTVTR